MKPVEFEESNKNLTKPTGWTDEQCRSLPVYSDGEQCISCWKMTFWERIKALFLGKIWLYVVFGSTQPPVDIKVQKTVFQKPASTK